MNGDASSPILVVDNDEDVRDFLQRVLTAEGYPVEIAVNGVDALKKLATLSLRLIILNLSLPAMDGWEFLKVYHHQRGPHVPVLVISAHQVSDELEGMSGFLPKPLNIDDLLTWIKSHGTARAS